MYDYVICGGGTSGCVLAARLAEDPHISVLVIEAGKDNSEIPLTQVPGAASRVHGGTDGWPIVNVRNERLHDREIKLSRGKLLGGSSGCNGTVCVRGTKQDYDDWEVEGWSGEEVFKYMAKAETFHPKEWFHADTASHGSFGPLHTSPQELAPISELLFKSYISRGLPFDADMFTSGNKSNGCGHAVRTVWNGIRTTAADYLTAARTSGRVTIKTSTYVDKINLEKDGDSEFRATSVEIMGTDGSKSTIQVSREVIISAGAYCSPAILLRSGIGTNDELMNIGIPCKINLPGVGKNLMDHLIVFIFYECSKAELTIDHLIYHDRDSASTAMGLWKSKKRGWLSSFPFGSFAYARLDERLDDSELWNSAARAPGRDPMGLSKGQPNIEFFNTECYGGPSPTHPPIDKQSTFAIIPQLMAPKSRGTVTIASADPMIDPVVDHNYLNNPLDMLVLSEACRFAHEIVTTGDGTKDVVKDAWPATLAYDKYASRKDWESFIRDNATTCFHPAGTCTMGSHEDPMTVVDKNLRVLGTSNIRVVDVSIMPKLNCGHTQMPAYAIGEKAAAIIKSHWANAT